MNKLLNSKFVRYMRSSTRTVVGVILILIVLILSFGAPLFTSYEPNELIKGEYRTAPGALKLAEETLANPATSDDADSKKLIEAHEAHEGDAPHILGVTSLGNDAWSRTIYGGQKSLSVGLLAAAITTILSMFFGISSGYIGGVYDSIVSTVINVLMVIPNLVLLLIIASLLGRVSPFLICVVIGLTSWPWGARVLRAQTMSIRNREFVFSAETLGESKLRILFIEIMPNMLTMISSSFVGTMIYAIMAHATLEFIGFGDGTTVTWGLMLNQAQTSNAFMSNRWWEFVGPVVMMMMFGLGLTLINFAIDEISNPKLKAQRIMGTYYKEQKKLKKANKGGV